MSQHTPGPWETLDGAEVTPKAGPQAFVTLAHIVGPWCESEWFTDKTEAQANGRLIAAAPEMLILLQSCLAYFDDMKNAGPVESSHPTGRDYAPDARWLAPIRALLREIEGQ